MDHILTFTLNTGEKLRGNIRAVSVDNACSKTMLLDFYLSKQLARTNRGRIEEWHLDHGRNCPKSDPITLHKNGRGFSGVFRTVKN